MSIVDPEGFSKDRLQSTGELERFFRISHAFPDECELIAPQARYQLSFTKASSKTRGDLDEEFVSCGMTEFIIDLLEVMKVQQQQHELAAPGDQSHQALIQPLVEGETIG